MINPWVVAMATQSRRAVRRVVSNYTKVFRRDLGYCAANAVCFSDFRLRTTASLRSLDCGSVECSGGS